MDETVRVLHDELSRGLVERRDKRGGQDFFRTFPLADMLPHEVTTEVILLDPDGIFIDETQEAVLHVPLSGKGCILGIQPQGVKHQGCANYVLFSEVFDAIVRTVTSGACGQESEQR